MNYAFIGFGALTALFAMELSQAKTIISPVPQPTTCIGSQFSATGNKYWKTVVLKLTNNCNKSVDFQNSTVSFKSNTAINTSFWGDFAPLPYPDNNLVVTSQKQTDNTYSATFNLHFPAYPGTSTLLPAGQSFQIKYGVSSDDHLDGSTQVYLPNSSETGTIILKNNSAKPSNVIQTYALVHILINGQKLSDVQVPWNATTNLTGLATGTYTLSPENITDSLGNNYQGTANPNTIVLPANQTLSSNVSYSMIMPTGKINVHLNALLSELSGYTANPTVLLTESSNGSSVSEIVLWDSTKTVSGLKEGSTYNFSTSPISYNGLNCLPAFSPSSLVASSTAPTTTLSYQCVQVIQDTVTLEVTGAPTTLSALNLTLTPNDNSSPVSQVIYLSNGSGSSTVSLTDGVIYSVSSDSVPGYSIGFSPQPLTASANAVETITLTPLASASGRIISYIPGWKTPPSAQSIANAGYTHVMIAFGVFSTSTPGVITPAFDTVTKEYIQALHQAGVKVILSLGGASSSIANTTVDFHQVVSAASSPDNFKQTFINSLNGLINQYGFDGFDIDIEHGLGGGGSFTQPQGDIAVLASIINTMHSQKPSLLITLTPQVANVAATSGFDQTWGNYASLIMQTHDSLAWVGIQLYNTGCAWGIDLICYGPTPTSTPDFSVAMATDLLENWPATVNGRATGFQSYISYLKPSQIVIGYPAPNMSGASDGAPVTPTATIKRALQCLKTASASSSSCGSYIPPKAYGMIGGVFNWEITYDQNNNFRFATDLNNCVKNGVCN